jgi:hypothetical protein
MAPEGSTAALLTRKNAPRTVQEPVAAPLSRCGHPVRFTKGITGLSLAKEGLLVKDITKFLTLSLPELDKVMTNARRRGQASSPRLPRVRFLPLAPGRGSSQSRLIAADLTFNLRRSNGCGERQREKNRRG